MRPGILTLTTDFGTSGPYVAAVKGVILGLAPGAQIVDVSHAIAPQNILEGAFVLASVVDAFPPGTVHLAVIDPGVGTARRMIAARMAGQWFVAPDNGLLSGIARDHAPDGVWELANPAIRRKTVSATFHGRDIMAPAAAHLLLGRDPSELGPARHGIYTFSTLQPRDEEGGFVGEVIFRDAFGNLITNMPGSRLRADPPESWSVQIAGHRVEGLCHTYAERPPGSLVALEGSSGWIEVAVVNGDAARTLTAGPGTTVWFRRRGRHDPGMQ
jgi:S-adenosyl-L-methionine hydrolase (adenosine-forming)